MTPTITTSHPIARLTHAPHHRPPRDVVVALEHDVLQRDVLPVGDDERFVGYGAMGISFASGHVLGLRRWAASSLGRPYTSVWLRTPAHEWRFIADISPELACPRYAGAIVQETATLAIRLAWTDRRTMVVEVPGVALAWTMTLRDSLPTRLFARARARLPEAWLDRPATLGVLAAGARVGLGTGPIRLTGHMPNGQGFRIVPHRLWEIESSHAKLDGRDLGCPVVTTEPVRLGDFRVPSRPLFAMATARFDTFDAAVHRSGTTRASSA